ncbi:MAG: hypothetical protein E7161_03125 [Firmicutes bacterium]|nr:hypothetical protein [Bacillota bacterium]
MKKSLLKNKDLCAKCGEKCFKARGCIYFVTDFESMKFDYLESILDTGRVSIKAQLHFTFN